MRIRAILGALAVVAICSLSTGTSSFAFEFPRVAPAAPAPEMRIDINAASLEELLKVPA